MSLLLEEEKYALSKLFSEHNAFDSAIISYLADASVLERKYTGIGYFVTIKFPHDLPNDDGVLARDWNFKHRLLKYGGSFTAFYNKPNVIELEAVAHDGNWLDHFNPEDFSDR